MGCGPSQVRWELQDELKTQNSNTNHVKTQNSNTYHVNGVSRKTNGVSFVTTADKSCSTSNLRGVVVKPRNVAIDETSLPVYRDTELKEAWRDKQSPTPNSAGMPRLYRKSPFKNMRKWKKKDIAEVKKVLRTEFQSTVTVISRSTPGPAVVGERRQSRRWSTLASAASGDHPKDQTVDEDSSEMLDTIEEKADTPPEYDTEILEILERSEPVVQLVDLNPRDSRKNSNASSVLSAHSSCSSGITRIVSSLVRPRGPRGSSSRPVKGLGPAVYQLPKLPVRALSCYNLRTFSSLTFSGTKWKSTSSRSIHILRDDDEEFVSHARKKPVRKYPPIVKIDVSTPLYRYIERRKSIEKERVVKRTPKPGLPLRTETTYIVFMRKNNPGRIRIILSQSDVPKQKPPRTAPDTPRPTCTPKPPPNTPRSLLYTPRPPPTTPRPPPSTPRPPPSTPKSVPSTPKSAPSTPKSVPSTPKSAPSTPNTSKPSTPLSQQNTPRTPNTPKKKLSSTL